MWIRSEITRDRGKAWSQQMTMTGTSLVEGMGNTAYPLKHEIREGKYFIRQKHKAQFCSQDRIFRRATHVRNKNLQLFEKWPLCCLQQFITQPRPHNSLSARLNL
jgi:hypothetical protein